MIKREVESSQWVKSFSSEEMSSTVAVVVIVNYHPVLATADPTGYD
jgi:hypothetical protein